MYNYVQLRTYSLDRFNVLMLEIKLLIEHVFNKIAYNNINISHEQILTSPDDSINQCRQMISI